MKKGQSPRKWTDEDINYMKSVYDGSKDSLSKIAIKLNTTIINIRTKINRLGFYLKCDRVQTPWSDDDIDKLKTLYQTHTTKEISELLGGRIGAVERAITIHIETKNGKTKRGRRKALDGKQLCSCCNIVKNIEEFVEPNKRNICRNCRNEKQRNRRRIKIKNMSPEELSKFRKHVKETRKRNKNRRLWSTKSKLKRRERERKLDICMSIKEITEIFNEFENKCFNCGSTDDLCLDHHYPLSKGFGLRKGNAVILCGKCNNCKSDKLPEKFYSKEQLDILKAKGILDKELIENLGMKENLSINRRKNPPIHFGEQNKNHKVTSEDVKKIRFMYNRSEKTVSELARMFGISTSTMHDIVLNKTWKHVK